MLIFLDDLRHPPAGATLCRTAEHAIALLESGKVTCISFDHDLGTEQTGYSVAKWIEERVAEGKFPMPDWRIHSANPVGRKNIQAAMESAARFSRMREEESASYPIPRAAAHEMGANGGNVPRAERELFEEWMRGHCWAVGEQLETGEYAEMSTRMLWAAWRDRAALAAIYHA